MTPRDFMRYEFFALSDVGRIRSNNEDAVAVHEGAKLALLADGMGGYNAGEVAAQMAVRLVGDELSQWLCAEGSGASAETIARALDASVELANRAITDASHDNPSYAGMGTTLVAAVFCGSQLVLGHLGDSRCYRLRGAELTLLTRDHSWLQEQIDAGVVSAEQASASGLKGLLTRALGVDETMSIEIQTYDTAPDDLYLLCSDGLTDMLGDAKLAALLRYGQCLQTLARTLIDEANTQGGRDNISVLLTRCAAAASEGSDEAGTCSANNPPATMA